MEIKINNTIKQAVKNVNKIHKKYVPKAMVTALNKMGKEVMTQAKRELKDATGLKAGTVAKKMTKDKARRNDETCSIRIKSRYLNLIEFNARQTKKGVSAKAWGKRRVYKHTFIGSGKDSGKQLVFARRSDNPKKLKALRGPSLPREFYRQDMESIFNKKIKTRFPTLFKNALEFQMLKARGRI